MPYSDEEKTEIKKQLSALERTIIKERLELLEKVIEFSDYYGDYSDEYEREEIKMTRHLEFRSQQVQYLQGLLS